MSIVVVGSIAFDDVVTKHETRLNALGGSALYFAAAASHFAPVHMVGVVGDDFPIVELDFLKERAVDISGVHIVTGGKTFRWGGAYELDMNIRATTALELNVFQDFKPTLNPESRNAPYVFLGNIDPDLQLDVLDQVDAPHFIAADTIECYLQDKPDRFREVLRRIDMLIVNDAEARLYTGTNNLFTAAREIIDQGPSYVIIKKGEHGSILASRDYLFVVPAYPLKRVVDPTGAGDSYAGGVMGWIARSGAHDWATLKKAVMYGGIVASFLVEGFSHDILKRITLNDIETRLRHFTRIISL